LIQPQATNQAASDQRLAFRLADTPRQPVEWWLNGRQIAAQTDNQVFWKLQPGDWQLQVRQGDVTDQIKFQVRLADPKQQRRGFTIGSQSKD
jgi:penicillin-binding protein 1C